MFLLRKWLEKLIKAGITAAIAYITGPRVTEVLNLFGVQVDPVQTQAGLWVVYAAAVNWVKHQPWTPKLLKVLL